MVGREVLQSGHCHDPEVPVIYVYLYVFYSQVAGNLDKSFYTLP